MKKEELVIENRSIDFVIEVLDRRVDLMAAAAGCSTTTSTTSTTIVPVDGTE
jgi:hypothetical protein